MNLDRYDNTVQGLANLEYKNIRARAVKLANNRRISVGVAQSGEYVVSIIRLKTPDEITGTSWKDKVTITCFTLSPEAFTTLFHLSSLLYNENIVELEKAFKENVIIPPNKRKD